MKNKLWLFWILAIVITLGAAVYQRKTGPTYPSKQTITINNNTYSFELPRSHNSTSDCNIDLKIPDTSISATVFYKRYPTTDEYSPVAFVRNGERLQTFIPSQPPAGKLAYYVELKSATGESVIVGKEEPVLIRYKGEVPAWVLIPHILLIFLAMLFSNFTGILAIAKHPRFRFWTRLTFWFLLFGGMVMGPFVQHFAFGAYWTGIPFGYDLTDNKTLIAFVGFIVAMVFNFKKPHRISVIIATVLMLVIFSIPHSARGSQLNYQNGQVDTGKQK